MSAKASATPSRKLLPSPMDKTPPSSTRKRALNELSINLPPRPHSAQDFTTPEHPNQNKKFRKVSDPSNVPLSASSIPSSIPRRESPGEDPVWGPEVEAAFMSAIKSIPKLGRRKICIGSKPCGRNELIADFIYRRTGRIRTRKQVSSHIQVLKHIRRDDVEFLALVADGKEGDMDDASATFDAKDLETFASAERPASVGQDYQLSIPQHEETSPIGQSLRMKAQTVAVPRSQLQVEEFCIWATKRDSSTGQDRVSHVYSGFDKHMTIPVAPIDAIADWAMRFPCLPSLVTESHNIGCPMFHLRASLDLPHSLDLEGEDQVVLRTQLSMTAVTHRPREQWVCTTRVYTLGNKVLELKQKVSMEQLASDDSTNNSHQQLGVKAAIPFATDFWAAFLAGLASLDLSLQNMSDAERVAKRERDSHNAVSGITVVQEIATAETSLEMSRRLNVLVWEFNKTPPGEDGQTVITRIALPETQMRAPFMGRSVSQPTSVPRKKVSRPSLNLALGQSLQRSQTVSAVPTQSSFHPQHYVPSHLPARQESTPPHFAPQQHQQQSIPVMPQQQQQQQQSQNTGVYYQPIYDHSQLPLRSIPQAVSNDLHTPFTVPSQVPAAHAMSRSFSAPTWTHNAQPTQYSMMDMSPWNDSFIDWTLPESASYLQSDFQVSSDDFFATPSRCQSTAPHSFSMEHTTSTAGTDIEDDAMPRLGFFPLANY